MTNIELLNMFASIFPDETVQTGQRLRKHQVEIINMIALELKERRIGVEKMQKSFRGE